MSRSALINLLRSSLAHRYLAVVLAGIAVLTMIPCLCSFRHFAKTAWAAFWGIGMLLSVVPACSANLPRGRLLVFVGIGSKARGRLLPSRAFFVGDSQTG